MNQKSFSLESNSTTHYGLHEYNSIAPTTCVKLSSKPANTKSLIYTFVSMILFSDPSLVNGDAIRFSHMILPHNIETIDCNEPGIIWWHSFLDFTQDHTNITKSEKTFKFTDAYFDKTDGLNIGRNSYIQFFEKMDPLQAIDNDFVLLSLGHSSLDRITSGWDRPTVNTVFNLHSSISYVEKIYPNIVNGKRWTVYETIKNYFFDYKMGWFFNSKMVMVFLRQI